LLDVLNPEKYHRTNPLPSVLRGPHSRSFLRSPSRENPEKPSAEVEWIPVLPRTVPNLNSGEDASLIISVRV